MAPDSSQSLVIRDSPVCSSCQLVIEQVARLGRPTDLQLIVDRPSVQGLANGSYAVSGPGSSTAVMRFDSAGRFVEAVGRSGDGPGEFRTISKIFRLGDDSLIVVDLGSRRVSVLDSRGRYQRSFAMPFPLQDVAILASGTWLVSGLAYDEDHIGLPIHRISSSGEVLQSFGGKVIVAEGRMASAQRILAARQERVWTASPVKYELEAWTPTGERRTHLIRQAGWFPSRDFDGSRTHWSIPIHPRLRDLFVDQAGLLWVMGTVAKEGWQPSPTNWGGIELEDGNLDTVLEVIDPSGQLLVSRRFPWVATGFTDEGLISSFSVTPDDIIEVRILRARLTRN